MKRRTFFRTLLAGLAITPLLKLVAQAKPEEKLIFPLRYHCGLRTIYIDPKWRDARYEIAVFDANGRMLDNSYSPRSNDAAALSEYMRGRIRHADYQFAIRYATQVVDV